MRLFTFVLLCLLACSAQSTSFEPPAIATPFEEACRSEPGDNEQNAATAAEMLLLAAARARTDDLRCGLPAPAIVACRALLVIANLDPANHGDDPVQLARVAETIDWALRSSMESTSDREFAEVLAELGALSRAIAKAGTDAERAQLVIERSQAHIVTALDEAWRACPT